MRLGARSRCAHGGGASKAPVSLKLRAYSSPSMNEGGEPGWGHTFKVSREPETSSCLLKGETAPWLRPGFQDFPT